VKGRYVGVVEGAELLTQTVDDSLQVCVCAGSRTSYGLSEFGYVYCGHMPSRPIIINHHTVQIPRTPVFPSCEMHVSV
jgi:hypothetical protein